MKDHYDPWYVRLPDGRTIKAKSTSSVRHHVEAGHIPLNSMLRRDPDEEWVALVWVAEFADLASPSARTMAPPAPAPDRPQQPPTGRSGVSARLDPMRLQTVGVRGLIDELISALDTTLARTKMIPAFIASLLVFVGIFAAYFVHRRVLNGEPESWVPGAVGCAFALVVLSILNALLTRLTHTEVSTMRPARLRDGLAGLGRHAVPVVVANALIAGGALVLLFFIHKVPGWAAGELGRTEVNDVVRKVLLTAVLVVATLLSVLCWLVIGLCWLLTPAIVVEESSWLAGIREWRQLVREHFGRVLVYEGLALMLGLAVALPLTVAVNLALYGQPHIIPGWPAVPATGAGWAQAGVVTLLEALTAAPLLAVLGVANVFIYLNLRYEQGPGH
jgi:hypothetical protein